MGAPGLESDVRLTSDGLPVLAHDAVIGPRFRRRPLAELAADELPPDALTLAGLYDGLGSAYDLSLDLKVPDSLGPVVSVAQDAGALDRLWLCGGLDEVLAWRHQDSRARLVHSGRRRTLGRELAPHVELLRREGVTALNLPARDWRSDDVRRTHESGVLAFAWDAHDVGTVARLVGLGCDAVYGDDVVALLAGAAAG